MILKNCKNTKKITKITNLVIFVFSDYLCTIQVDPERRVQVCGHIPTWFILKGGLHRVLNYDTDNYKLPFILLNSYVCAIINLQFGISLIFGFKLLVQASSQFH